MSRTPKRSTPTAPARRRWPTGRKARVLEIVAAVGLIAVLAGVALYVLRDDDSSGADPKQALTAADCTLTTYPSQGQDHVQSLDAKVDYNSFPPTSGPHYLQPAVWDAYNAPLVPVQVVHNLEHGGVAIQYGSDVSNTTVAQLLDFYRHDPNGMLLAPLPALGSKIALTAWTELATCQQFDQSAFAAFRDRYRGQGPEGFPVDSLTPGS